MSEHHNNAQVEGAAVGEHHVPEQPEHHNPSEHQIEENLLPHSPPTLTGASLREQLGNPKITFVLGKKIDRI